MLLVNRVFIEDYRIRNNAVLSMQWPRDHELLIDIFEPFEPRCDVNIRRRELWADIAVTVQDRRPCYDPQ
jgi:hypothetical protein